MQVESFLCKEMGILKESAYERLQKFFKAASIPNFKKKYPFHEMKQVLQRDKKGLSFVALEDIGKPVKKNGSYLFQVPDAILEKVL